MIYVYFRDLLLLRCLLCSTDVDLRITAGEAIALLLEAAYDFDEVITY